MSLAFARRARWTCRMHGETAELPLRWRRRRVRCREQKPGRAVFACSDLLAEDRSPTGGAAWATLTTRLQQADVTMIKAQEVAFCAEKGMVILDIRTEEQFSEGFIEGAVNVPLYRLIEGWELAKVMRRVGYAAFGVFKGTEINPHFMDEVAEVVTNRNGGIVVCCNLGGDLRPPKDGSPGIQSRSLVAAYELLQAGYSPIKVLDGGVHGWRDSGRDLFVFDAES